MQQVKRGRDPEVVYQDLIRGNGNQKRFIPLRDLDEDLPDVRAILSPRQQGLYNEQQRKKALR